MQGWLIYYCLFILLKKCRVSLGFTFSLSNTYIVYKHKHTVLKPTYRTCLWPTITSANSSHWQRKATWHKWIKGRKEKRNGMRLMKQSSTAFIKTYWNAPTEMLTQISERHEKKVMKRHLKIDIQYILRVCMSIVAHYK